MLKENAVVKLVITFTDHVYKIFIVLEIKFMMDYMSVECLDTLKI